MFYENLDPGYTAEPRRREAAAQLPTTSSRGNIKGARNQANGSQHAHKKQTTGDGNDRVFRSAERSS